MPRGIGNYETVVVEAPRLVAMQRGGTLQNSQHRHCHQFNQWLEIVYPYQILITDQIRSLYTTCL